MRSVYLFFGLFLLMPMAILAQENFNPYVDSIFTVKKEVYFKFNISSKTEIESLTNMISIDNVTADNVVYAYANKKEFQNFILSNYSYTLLTNPGDVIKDPAMFDVGEKNANAWNAYPTYAAYEAMMYQYATDHPTLCQIYNIKTLASGRKLLIAKISHNVTTHENEPQFLYTSTIHGNETSGYIHMLHLIDTLLNNYGSNARITNILDNTEIWINPLANPDGTYGASGGSSVSGAIRGNANGVDLNRNFPDFVSGQHPDGNSWQPETQAWMSFTDTMHFVMSANFHEGAEVCNYPWDTKAALTADNSWWQLVSKQFADTAHAYGPSGFFTDVTSSGYTDGYAWYYVHGGRQDFMNYYRHCREETIEISETQVPSGSSLPTLWKGCKRSLFNYLEQSLKGIRGIVSDSCTGAPIRALVKITGHDADSSQVYSALPVGNYHRLIYTGTYNLTFSATGYQSRTINNISITNGNTVIRNVKLMANSPAYPVANYTYSLNGLIINLTNTSTNGISYSWDFGDGNSSTLANPSHTYASSGTYNVQLIVYNGCGSDTITEQVTIVNVGISDLDKVDEYTVFPNPSDGIINISLSSEKISKISLTDLTGKMIYESGQNNLTVGIVHIDLSNFTRGVYILNVTTQEKNLFSKIILQ